MIISELDQVLTKSIVGAMEKVDTVRRNLCPPPHLPPAPAAAAHCDLGAHSASRVSYTTHARTQTKKMTEKFRADFDQISSGPSSY